MDAYSSSLFLHVAAGSIALASFWTAALLRKGSVRHRCVGRVFLLAMVAVLASGVPLVSALVDRGQLVGALFLGFLLLLVSQSSWIAWRAIRDRADPARFFGPVYWLLTILCAVGGAGIVALGFAKGAIILQAFGGVGVLAGIGCVRSWRRWRAGRSNSSWWLREHYSAMIGNGVATHVAFLGVGLRNALPFIEPQLQQYLAWLLPLSIAVAATAYLDRRHRSLTRRAAVRGTAPEAVR